MHAPQGTAYGRASPHCFALPDWIYSALWRLPRSDTEEIEPAQRRPW